MPISPLSLRSNLLLFCACLGLSALHADDQRTRLGLLGLYEFSESEGADVRDTASSGAPVDLKLSDINRIRRSQGSLQITGKAVIRSDKAPSRFIMAIKRAGEFSLEAWIQTDRLNQSGPARILTLSKDSSNRNVTLGQDGDQLQVRFRTTKTSTNGLPALTSPQGSLSTDLTHVVFTCTRSGHAKLYLNGSLVAEQRLGGSTSNWGHAHTLAFGDEVTGGRPWFGTYHLVALYNRDLIPSEVQRHYDLGPDATTEPPFLAEEVDPNVQLFEDAIAPIFAKHCLECHDTATRKGKLDLSNKLAAAKGGSEGPSMVPGNAEQSLLWELVKFDDMPEDRKPLLDEEKALLKQWIEGGAQWGSDTIDPLAHKRDQRAGENWVRRLTVDEYIETVRASLGVDIAQAARERLPRDLRADGFSNTAYNLGVDFEHIEAYAELAALIVARVDLKAFTRRFAKNLTFTDKAMGDLIGKMGKWVLRGPLEDHEIIAYRGITTAVASAGGAREEAVGYVLEAMLQSPRFIYQIENQRGDGKVWPISEFELASRLSYILWGAPPDETLFAAAERGELYDPTLIEAQVDRMLQDPRAIEQSKRFFSEWLNLNRLGNLRPNAEKFPHWDPQLASDMQAESLAFFEDLIWEQQRPLSALLNAQFTYLTPRLAKHYRVDAPLNGDDPGLQRVNLSGEAARGGLLTHGSVLTIGGDEASMVTRGLFVLHDLLRSGVKDPPPGVDTNPVPTKPGLTQRAIAEKRVADRSCGGCHSKFEPLAFGLERYDGLGSYFEKDEHDNALREDGEILFPGTAEPVPFESAAQLMDLLAGSERVQENFSWKVTQFALGRPLVPGDRSELEKIHELALEGGATYASLIKAIVLSNLVRTTRTENSPSES